MTKQYRLEPPSGPSWGDTQPDSVAGTWEEQGAVGKGVFLHGYREEQLDSLKAIRDFLIATASDPTIALVQGKLRDGASFQIDGNWRDVLGRTQENYEDYARHLLVLDADEIAGDINDAADIVRDLIYTVPELDGCAHVACFSPSAGVKPGIRVRLFILTTEPHTLASQKAWVLHANQRAGRRLFDPSVYGPQSFLALAGPMLYAETSAGTVRIPRPVPNPIAWWFDGDPADIGVTRAAAQIGLDPRDVAYIEQYGSLPSSADKTDWLGEMAAGNVAIPLHRALCRAAFAAPDEQQGQHFGAFLAAARKRLLEIDSNEYQRREREHLNVRRLQQAWDKARSRRQAVTPSYRAMPTVILPPTAISPRQQLANEVVAAAKEILAGNPIQVLATSPPGAGKSYSIIKALDAGVLASNKTLTVAPTHELADQLTTDHKKHAMTLAPGGNHYGMDLPAMIRHHKGRKLLCTNDRFGKMAERAERLGLSAKKTACASCPDRHTCPWIAQGSDDATGEIVKAHAAMFNKYAEHDEWAQMHFIDENPVGSVMDDSIASDMPIDDLKYQGGFSKLRDARTELTRLLLASVPRGQNERALVPSSFTPERINQMLTFEEKHRETISKNLVNATDAKFERDMKQITVSRFATALLSNMLDSHRMTHYKAIRVYHHKSQRMVTTKRRLMMPPNILDKGAIYLDGTARLDPDLAVWKAIISPTGAPFAYRTIDVAPTPGNVRITQVVDASFAKTSLLPRADEELDAAIDRAQNIASATWIANALADDPSALRLQQGAAYAATALDAKRRGRKKRADSRLYAVWLTVLKQAFSHSHTLLVAQKDVLTALSNMGLPANVRKAHFGALRGLNSFKDVPAATIVGRPALDNYQLELQTEALFVANDSVLPIAHAEGWGKQMVPVALTDGTTASIACDGHPDANCRSLQALISHAEVAQAVARIRPYDRGADNPCEVAVFGQWPVGLPVDRIANLDDVRPAEADVALRALGVFDDASTTIDVFDGLYRNNPKDAASVRGIALDYVRLCLKLWLHADKLTDELHVADLQVAPSIEQLTTVSISHKGSRAEGVPGDGVLHDLNNDIDTVRGSSPQGSTEASKKAAKPKAAQISYTYQGTAYEFVELLIAGHGKVQRQRAKKVTAIVRAGADQATIEARAALKVRGMRKLGPPQVRKYCLQLVRGLIAYEVKRSPALEPYANAITDDVAMLEFIEMWCGWNLSA